MSVINTQLQTFNKTHLELFVDFLAVAIQHREIERSEIVVEANKLGGKIQTIVTNGANN